jgi:hypothetical protein
MIDYQNLDFDVEKKLICYRDECFTINDDILKGALESLYGKVDVLKDSELKSIKTENKIFVSFKVRYEKENDIKENYLNTEVYIYGLYNFTFEDIAKNWNNLGITRKCFLFQNKNLPEETLLWIKLQNN